MKHLSYVEVSNAVVSKVTSILACDEPKATDTLQSLGADSLDVVDIVCCLEDELGVEVSGEEMSGYDVKTIGELTDIFYEKL